MRWANFLHLYQPADQQADILQAIVAQSYRPLVEGLKANPRIRMTLNVNGSLLDLFAEHGQVDLISDLRSLSESGQVEFTGSTKYHAILPFISEEEMERQITLNTETLVRHLGPSAKPKGFFPPEMAYDPRALPVLEKLGFEWLILDEISCGGEVGNVDYTRVNQIAGSKLKAFFRERRLSNLIMSAVVRTEETLVEAMRDDMASERYIVTGMDGETFGHHRPGLNEVLFDVLGTTKFDLVTISEIPAHYPETVEVTPVKATWASSKQDIDAGIQFLSWADPENEVHAFQRAFTDLVVQKVYAMDTGDAGYPAVRAKLDAALASDHFWWASAKPWWSLEMIEVGAWRLLDALRSVPGVSAADLDRGRDLYEKIVSTAFNWQRTGKIRQMMQEQKGVQRVPFKERTLEQGGVEEGVYRAFIDMMRGLEAKAAEREEYEQAILWRDALYKVEHKLDVYDAVNAIDLLRTQIPHEEVEAMLDKYTAPYRAIRGGQPEQRGS